MGTDAKNGVRTQGGPIRDTPIYQLWEPGGLGDGEHVASDLARADVGADVGDAALSNRSVRLEAGIGASEGTWCSAKWRVVLGLDGKRE